MADNSGNNKRIAKNTLFLYIRMGLVLVVSLFTTRVVLHALGVEDYGIYNVVSGFVTMFAFINTSMSNGVQRFYNFSLGRKNEYSITEVYNTAIQIQGILSLVILILLETFGIWYIYNQMVIPPERFSAALWVFQFSALSLVVLMLQIPYSASIMAYEKMDYFAYLSIFEVLTRLGIAYAVKYASSDKLILYGALQFIVSLAVFVLFFVYAKRNFKELKLVFTIRKDLFASMFSFSGWNVLGTFSYMIKSQGLNMLLNVFFGPVVNAARGVSSMIMSAIVGFQSNIIIAFRPQLVKSYAEENTSRVIKMFYSLSKVSFILLSLLSIPVIIEIDYILKLWLGNSVPEYTIPFTILVLINMIVSSLNMPVTLVVHATGKVKNYQIVTSLIVCAILPVSWIFLKLGYSPVSVYVVSLAITTINQAVCNLLLKRIFDYNIAKYSYKVILPCLSFAAIVPVLPYLVTIIIPSSFFRLLLTTITAVTMACIVAYLIVLDNSEKKLVVDIIKKKIIR